MFNSAPSLKECSSISNTMLLIAASERLQGAAPGKQLSSVKINIPLFRAGADASLSFDGVKQSEAAGPSQLVLTDWKRDGFCCCFAKTSFSTVELPLLLALPSS